MRTKLGQAPAYVGRWVDESVPALFVVYHMKEDIGEAELREIQKPRARQLAAQYPIVIQVTVHDGAWAARLTTEELRQRIINIELPIGSDLVLQESMSVRGGLVYTYYKNGDYDEFIYHERSDGPGN
jgi:hypothetical protein